MKIKKQFLRRQTSDSPFVFFLWRSLHNHHFFVQTHRRAWWIAWRYLCSISGSWWSVEDESWFFTQVLHNLFLLPVLPILLNVFSLVPDDFRFFQSIQSEFFELIDYTFTRFLDFAYLSSITMHLRVFLFWIFACFCFLI